MTLTCCCIHLLGVKVFTDKRRAEPRSMQPGQEHHQQHATPLGPSLHSFHRMSDREESRAPA